MLVLARAVNHVLESRAVEIAVGEPLSSSKVQILRLLGQRGAQSSSRVAYYLGVSKPAVSQIIDSMVRDKLVSRKPSKHDRREVELTLTTTGRKWYKATASQQRQVLRAALRNHPAGSADHWAGLLRQIAESIARADKAFDSYCLQCAAYANGTCVLMGGDADCMYLRDTRVVRKARRGPAKAQSGSQ